MLEDCRPWLIPACDNIHFGAFLLHKRHWPEQLVLGNAVIWQSHGTHLSNSAGFFFAFHSTISRTSINYCIVPGWCDKAVTQEWRYDVLAWTSSAMALQGDLAQEGWEENPGITVSYKSLQGRQWIRDYCNYIAGVFYSRLDIYIYIDNIVVMI